MTTTTTGTPDPEPSPARVNREEILALVRDGKRVEAIHRLRVLTDLSLAVCNRILIRLFSDGGR